MPKITIFEKDLTEDTESNIITNAVYIPGYAKAITGVNNIGIHLCRTVNEFESLFGKEPIAFSGDVAYSTCGFTSIEGNLITAGDLDKSFIEAYALVKAGIPVLYDCIANGDNDLDNGVSVGVLYNKLAGNGVESLFHKLADRSNYNVKFITSGGFPVLGCNTVATDEADEDDKKYTGLKIAQLMCKIAAIRGEAIALIDHEDNYTKLVGTNSLQSKVANIFENSINVILDEERTEDARKYGTMITPYGKEHLSFLESAENKSGEIVLPGSFRYLMNMADSIKTNPNWYAIAGVQRALAPKDYEPKQKITGAVADKLQARTGFSINPITYINPYGYAIWGNRTLNYNGNPNEINDGLVASSFLNVRNLVCDVKKVVYTACRELTFENNTDVLWLNFKSKVEPLLDQMVTGNGLINYKITKLETTKRATIVAKIRLTVIEAVEDWDMTVELADSYVTIE